MSLSDDYADLLLIQYANKPKARAEAKAYGDEWEAVQSFAASWIEAWDIDKAWGDRLDKIGKIVGIDRIVENGYAKKYFGFYPFPNSLPWGNPFFRKFRDDAYTDTELDDNQFRFFIKSKVAKNITAAVMASGGERQSLQNTVQYLFEGKAYVVDNFDMTLGLYLDETYSQDDLRVIVQENLLPSPQGVGYKYYIQYNSEGTFGFANNPNSKPWGEGAHFARKILL